MTKRFRYALTCAFYALVLSAFAYGSTGCVSQPAKDPIPCPENTEMRIQTLVQVEHCEGASCEMLMVACFVTPEDVAHDE